MKNMILRQYIKPLNLPYKLFTIVHTRFISLCSLSVLCILTYPALYYLYLSNTDETNRQQHRMLQQRLLTENELLKSLQNHQININKKEGNLASLHQQIKSVLDHDQANIEHIQWGFDNGKVVYLTVNQQTEKIFHIIHQLNRLDSLKFKEISLIKLGHDRLVQLNTTLSVLP
ncbi:hypothetical protein [Glaesserella sp.]|uniref:hypothetical protein n=1 Tax=Glaesserella sp. TaxID=2094731 RepID=UPI00359F6163